MISYFEDSIRGEDITKSGKNMVAAIEKTGLYKVLEGSLVHAEIMAYDAAFSVLEDLLTGLLKRAFVQTANASDILYHEKLVGFGGRNDVPLDKRRELIIYRLSVAPFDFTAEGIVRSIRAVGVDADIEENYAGESLEVTIKSFIDSFDGMDILKARISRMLPAHLEWELDAGLLTWDAFDGSDVKWDSWDAADFTWDMFDVDGHNILENI